MPSITRTLPWPAHHQSSMIILDRWNAEKPEVQCQIADKILEEWAGRELPVGFDSVTCFTSSRGDTVISCQQWSDPTSTGNGQQRRTDAGVSAGPDSTQEFVHFRSFAHQDSAGTECFVFVTFDFETTERALRWLQLLRLAFAPAEEPVPGCISRKLFLSADGLTVLNYSEWESEDDHRTSIEAPPTSRAWQRLESFEGMSHGPGARCRLHGTVANASLRTSS